MSQTVPIKYVGLKESETEHLYGTNLVFLSGETKDVPVEAAKKMLAHPDVFEQVGGEPLTPAVKPKVVIKEVEDTTKKKDTPEPIVFHEATKKDLVAYAKRNFNLDIDPSIKKDEMIAKIKPLQAAFE